MTLPQDTSTRVVVIDTNIVLDLLLFAEPAVEPLRQALQQQRLRWLAIPRMRNELERVLQYPQIAPRMAFYGHSPEQLLQRMDAVVQYVEPAGPAGVSCKDTDDQCFVDLAAAHQAILLSKDAQVLKLRKRLAKQQVLVARLLPDSWEPVPAL